MRGWDSAGLVLTIAVSRSRETGWPNMTVAPTLERQIWPAQASSSGAFRTRSSRRLAPPPLRGREGWAVARGAQQASCLTRGRSRQARHWQHYSSRKLPPIQTSPARGEGITKICESNGAPQWKAALRLASIAAAGERFGVGAVAHVDERIVGLLDPVGELAGHEQQGPLRLGAVGDRLVDGERAELDELA